MRIGVDDICGEFVLVVEFDFDLDGVFDYVVVCQYVVIWVNDKFGVDGGLIIFWVGDVFGGVV